MKNIRVVMVEAQPCADSPEFGEVAGAFVNIYTTELSEPEALRIANFEIANAGWLILSVENQYVLSRAEVRELPDTLAYYEQALLDGVVLVFNTYEHGGEEPKVVH